MSTKKRTIAQKYIYDDDEQCFVLVPVERMLAEPDNSEYRVAAAFESRPLDEVAAIQKFRQAVYIADRLRSSWVGGKGPSGSQLDFSTMIVLEASFEAMREAAELEIPGDPSPIVECSPAWSYSYETAKRSACVRMQRAESDPEKWIVSGWCLFTFPSPFLNAIRDVGFSANTVKVEVEVPRKESKLAEFGLPKADTGNPPVYYVLDLSLPTGVRRTREQEVAGETLYVKAR